MKPCPYYGGGHHWRLSPFESYISRSTCDCGAVQFEADTRDGEKVFLEELDSRVKELNKTEGKEGTLEKQGEAISTIEHQTTPDSATPIPSRPDLTGLKLTQRNKVMHKYYEENAAAILEDRAATGDKETIRRWGFSQCGYRNFLKRRGLAFQGKASARPRKKAAEPAVGIKAVDKANGQETEVKVCPECKHLVTAEGLGHKRTCSNKQILANMANRHLPEASTADKAGQVIPTGFQETIIQMPTSVTLPALPSFDNAWPELVQLRWLDTYRDIVRR